MERGIPERRRLELLIRRSEAEERLLERRLERLTVRQRRERDRIDTLLHEEPWRRFTG